MDSKSYRIFRNFLFWDLYRHFYSVIFIYKKRFDMGVNSYYYWLFSILYAGVYVNWNRTKKNV